MALDFPPDDEDPTPMFEVQDDRLDPLSLDLVIEEDEQERAERERHELERAEREREGNEPPAKPDPTEEAPTEEAPSGPAWEPPPPSVVGIEQAPPAGLDLVGPDDIPELVEEPAPLPAPPEPEPEEFEPLPDVEPVLSEDQIEPASPIDDTLT